MSDVFHLYDRQYSELSLNISEKCSLAFSLRGGQREQKLSEIAYDLENAEKIITKMDHAASSLPAKTKFILLEKLRKSKFDLRRLKSDITRNTSGNLNTTTAREEFLEANREALADQRSRLMQSTEGLVRTTETIKDCRRKMLETEQIGISILENLQSQRQSLQRTEVVLNEIDDDVKESRSILTDMKIREFFTAVGAAGPIIIYVLFKLVKKASTTSPDQISVTEQFLCWLVNL